jgi:hypothetical protein
MLEAVDRSTLWLPLLRRLTAAFPGWVIWKNADAALSGSGDVDSAASRAQWDPIVKEFRNWAEGFDLEPVVVCTHPPRTMFLLGMDRGRSTFAELDVLGRKYFRGWTLFRAEDLPPLASMDPRGFRVLRPGAQALILLVMNGARWGGRRDAEGLVKRNVPELLAEDRDGLVEAAGRFGLPVSPVRRLAESVIAGSWDRRSMLQIEGAAMAKAFSEPNILARRIQFKFVVRKHCPVLKAVFQDDRHISGDVEAWLREVSRTHTVLWKDDRLA